MPAIRWTSLTLLTLGYCIALSFGYLSLPAAVTFGLLVMAGVCVTQFNQRPVVCLGHGLFISSRSRWLFTGYPDFSVNESLQHSGFRPKPRHFRCTSIWINR